MAEVGGALSWLQVLQRRLRRLGDDMRKSVAAEVDKVVREVSRSHMKDCRRNRSSGDVTRVWLLSLRLF